jgi:alkylation response protein AidB-like acyl-CoA dehydrogenase
MGYASRMGLTDEQRAFAEAIREFCSRECGTREKREALTDGGAEAHSGELYGKLAELGWTGVSIPEEYGGAGGGIVEQCVYFHELWRGMAPVYGAGSTATVAGCVKRFGSDEQKQRLLREIADGAVMSVSISEPEAGSDVGNVSARAVRSNGRYILTGQKTWCSSAHLATRILVLARTDKPEKRHQGLTLFDVPADADGLEIRPIDTMGGRDVNDIFMTDVEVAEEQVVGVVGEGFKQIMAGLNGERLVAAAQGLGMAERTLEDLLVYVKERKQFGKPIGTFQALRHRIADMATDLQCARSLTYELAQMYDERPAAPELTRLTSMAKLKVTETAKHAALEGMQMMGGYGYATEYDMERHVRVALAPPIYAGTNEIQRDIIAGSYGLKG